MRIFVVIMMGVELASGSSVRGKSQQKDSSKSLNLLINAMRRPLITEPESAGVDGPNNKALEGVPENPEDFEKVHVAVPSGRKQQGNTPL